MCVGSFIQVLPYPQCKGYPQQSGALSTKIKGGALALVLLSPWVRLLPGVMPLIMASDTAISKEWVQWHISDTSGLALQLWKVSLHWAAASATSCTEVLEAMVTPAQGEFHLDTLEFQQPVKATCPEMLLEMKGMIPSKVWLTTPK